MMQHLKAYSLILFFSLSFITPSFSQTGINQLKLDSGEWVVEKIAGGSGGTTYHANYIYKLCGDTVINSLLYKRLFAAIQDLMSGPPAPPVFQPHGYFRQDSLSKQSYFYQMTVNTDSLIMDYNLNVGDTIKRGFYSYGLGNGYNKIIKIDSMLFGGKKYRTLYTDTTAGFSNPPGIWFIEGIGNTCGFLEPITIPMSGYATFLTSFTQSYACNDLAGVEPVSRNTKKLVLFPNPVSNELYVSTSYFIRKISLVDMLGNEAKEFNVVNELQEISLKIAELSKGIYTVKVFYRDNTSSISKFIKE